jgi:hypothetical protein
LVIPAIGASTTGGSTSYGPIRSAGVAVRTPPSIPCLSLGFVPRVHRRLV